MIQRFVGAGANVLRAVRLETGTPASPHPPGPSRYLAGLHDSRVEDEWREVRRP